MATTNRDRVARVMDLLKEGLGPFVLREYKMVYRKDYGREIFEALRSDRYEPPSEMFESEEGLLAQVDAQG